MKRFLCFILCLTFILTSVSCADDTVELTSSDAELVLEPSQSSSEESTPEFSSEEPESSASSSEALSSESSSQQSQPSETSSSLPQSSVSSAASASVLEPSSQSASQPPEQVYSSDETRAIWFSYLEWQTMMTGKTQSQFTANINSAFDKAAALGINTVYVHARSHSDAFYDSDIFPWSVYCAGTEGSSPGYDPLAIMVSAAHSRGMKIEAWINPYRIKGTTDTTKIARSSPAYEWLGTDKVKSVSGAGIYYNPAEDEVIQLVVDGVKEIVRNYDVDGIHFDDYFYPTTDASFDSSSYEAYIDAGGTMGLADWRRDNVNRLIRQVYSAIKSIDGSCVFGVSPTGNMDNNYSLLYCDVYAWLRSDQYIDYICPQIYFGFEHDYSPYTTVLDQYNSMISNSGIKLVVGLAAYKSGQSESSYAGDGINEWINDNDILSRQILAARKKSHYEGFALYRYDSLFNPVSSVSAAVAGERAGLEAVLK